MRRLRALCLLFVGVGCGAEATEEPLDDPSLDEPRISTFQYGSYFETAFVKTGDLEWASGAVLVPFLDEEGNQKTVGEDRLRGTCGVTFVTPSYAVTAAHCVDADDVPDPANDTLWVEMYNVVPWFSWQSLDSLLGSFPNFSSLINNVGLLNGYNAEAFPCNVVARCGEEWGQYECQYHSSDLALLECAGQPGNKYGFVDVAEQDVPVGKTAIMPWAHELYAADPSNPDHYDHYIDWYWGSPQLNYHYFEEGKLFPLRAIGQWHGDIYKSPRVLNYASSNSSIPFVRWTTLQGCHGTSGSGIGHYNATTGHEELLGPVARGDQMAGLLCHPATADSDKPAMGYTSRSQTASVVERARCGGFNGSLLLWLRCHRIRLWEEVKFPDFGFDWPMFEGPPLERWRITNEPVAGYPIGADRLDLPFGEMAERVRVSVHVLAPESMLDAPVELWYGDEPIAEVSVDGEHSVKLTAEIETDGESVVSVRYAGELPLGLSEITVADPSAVNGFDTMAERAGFGQLGEEGELSAMRFVARGDESGFAAQLRAGETMVITRQSFVRGADAWVLNMAVEGESDGIEAFIYDATEQEPVPMEVWVEDGQLTAMGWGVELPVAMTITASPSAGELLIDDVVVRHE